MGTNYYIYRDKCETCGHEPGPIHIGKSSAGWQFSFAPYKKLGLTSWHAWKKYLQTSGAVIYNEYGDEISTADFQTLVEGLQSQPNNWRPGEDPDKHETRDSEGYRFANTWDFS